MRRRSIVLTVIAIPFLAVVEFYIYLSFFWKPGFSPLVQLGTMVESKANAALQPIEHASVIVFYDQNGEMWLGGPSAKDTRTYENIAALRTALTALHGKGLAILGKRYSETGRVNGIDGLFASLPPANLVLESEIKDALLAAGFTPANDLTPAYNLHVLPGFSTPH
jgi:hypothetical protein